MFKRGGVPSSFQIRAGSNRVSTGGLLIPVLRIIEHETFVSRTLVNDICILKLSRNLGFSASVRAINLPEQGLVLPNAVVATITGWGVVNNRGGLPVVLQTADVQIIGNAECELKIANPIRINELCAGVQLGRDACWGGFLSNLCL